MSLRKMVKAKGESQKAAVEPFTHGVGIAPVPRTRANVFRGRLAAPRQFRRQREGMEQYALQNNFRRQGRGDVLAQNPTLGSYGLIGEADPGARGTCSVLKERANCDV